MAEAIFRKLVNERGVAGKVFHFCKEFHATVQWQCLFGHDKLHHRYIIDL